MFRGKIVVFALLGSIALSGCAGLQGFPDRSIDTADEVASLNEYLKPSAITAYTSDDPAARHGLSRKDWRNQVIEARIRADDLHFADFEKSLYQQGIGFGVGTDWVLLALNGAGAVAGGAANALSAAAAGVTGARSSYERDALYNRTLPVLMAQMVAQRKTILVRVREGEGQEDGQYPLNRGLSDLEDYYYAGTIPGAINNLAENAGAQSKQADQDLKDLQVVGPVDPALQTRRANAADYVKTLTIDQRKMLATAMTIPTQDDPLRDILLAIAAAQKPDQFDPIAQEIKVLFGKDF